MTKTNFKHTGVTCSESGPFTRHKGRMQILKETGESRYIYKNDSDKVCFLHYIAYNSYKDIAR